MKKKKRKWKKKSMSLKAIGIPSSCKRIKRTTEDLNMDESVRNNHVRGNADATFLSL